MDSLKLMDQSDPAWKPLHIAVIGGRGIPSNYSGVERICEELFVWFAGRGHKVTVYCRPGVLESKLGDYRGIRLVRTPAPGGKNGETLSHSMFSLLHAAFKGDNGTPFDVASLHTIAPNLFAPIATFKKIPVITHVHGLDHQREKWKGLGARIIRTSEKVMVKSASKLIGVNPAICDYYRDEYGLDVAYLPNGVYRKVDRPADASILAEFGLEPGGYVTTVGRLVPEKRLHDTIKAYFDVPGDKKLVFVGDAQHTPDYLRQLQELAEHDPKKRVVFTGLQTGAHLEALFRGAACYVSASELEGNPMSVLECMEYHVPAALSDISGHWPLYKRVNGYDLSFQVGDIAAITERINRVINNPKYAFDLADKCRDHVRREFAWPGLAERTEALYLRIVNSQTKQPGLRSTAAA